MNAKDLLKTSKPDLIDLVIKKSADLESLEYENRKTLREKSELKSEIDKAKNQLVMADKKISKTKESINTMIAVLYPSLIVDQEPSHNLYLSSEIKKPEPNSDTERLLMYLLECLSAYE